MRRAGFERGTVDHQIMPWEEPHFLSVYELIVALSRLVDPALRIFIGGKANHQYFHFS